MLAVENRFSFSRTGCRLCQKQIGIEIVTPILLLLCQESASSSVPTAFASGKLSILILPDFPGPFCMWDGRAERGRVGDVKLSLNVSSQFELAAQDCLFPSGLLLLTEEAA